MSLVTDFLDWLQTLPSPALVGVTGGMVFFETTIWLGTVLPGEAGLIIASTTATTPSRFLTLWLVVTICQIAGDSMGYAIGKRWGPRLRETRLIQRHGLHARDKATDVLRRRGAWAVLFARFLPLVRSLTPAAAGTSGLPFSKFLPVVVVGAASWAAMHIGLGVALGAAVEQFNRYFTYGGFAVLVIFAVAILVRRKKQAAVIRDEGDTSAVGEITPQQSRDESKPVTRQR